MFVVLFGLVGTCIRYISNYNFLCDISGLVKFNVLIMAGSGEFEVCENGTQVVTGYVCAPNEPSSRVPVLASQTASTDPQLIQLMGNDVYKELRLRGYEYGPTFQGILSASNHADSGYLKWNNNWVSFLDTMLQIQALHQSGLCLPTRIQKMIVDPVDHKQHIIDFDSKNEGKTHLNLSSSVCFICAQALTYIHIFF